MISLPQHPLQSDAWAEFREKSGTNVIKEIDGFYMSIHPVPKLPFTIGYIPKCLLPDQNVIEKIKSIGKKNKCIFIKFEPNVVKNSSRISHDLKLNPSPHPLFTNYTFHIDLTKPADELLKNMKPKTRYNIRIAQKHHVIVKEDNSKNAFKAYVHLSQQTWKRKGFRAHDEIYHRTMWQVMRKADIAHLLIASYKPSVDQLKSIDSESSNQNADIPLVSWILFLYKNVLYYPYGASSDQYRQTMASNLMMWEAIHWGKQHDAKLFDLWGALGPNPDKNHPWYGFHKFKEGYGAELIELVGSYDLVLNPLLYRLYNLAHPIREKLLGM